jgi:hypothetical protein
LSAAHGCDDCVFYAANGGKFRVSGGVKSRCELRGLSVNDPMFTTCGNHVLRNPLRRRELIGPVWAPVPKRFDFIDWRSDYLPPPDLMQPGEAENHLWIPYAGRRRPRAKTGGKCAVCDAERAETIAVVPGKVGELRFCSVFHYWAWWWACMKEVEPSYWNRQWETHDEFSTGLGMIMEWFPKAWPPALANHDGAGLLKMMRGFDECLRCVGITRADVLDAAVIGMLKIGNAGGRLAEAMLQLWVELFEAGNLLADQQWEREPVEATMELVEACGEQLMDALTPDLHTEL